MEGIFQQRKLSLWKDKTMQGKNLMKETTKGQYCGRIKLQVLKGEAREELFKQNIQTRKGNNQGENIP